MTEDVSPSESKQLAETPEIVEFNENPLASLPPEILARIKAASSRIKDSSSFSARKVSIAAGGMKYRLPDLAPEEALTSKFTAVIVGVKHANRLYLSPYVQGRPVQADCVAVNLDGTDTKNPDLKPVPDVAGKYSDNCESCPHFQWESNPAGSGKGKMCTEYTLCVVYIPALGNDLYLIEQKKGRSQKMDTHVKTITNRFDHPMAVYTQFSIAEGGEPWDQNFYATDFVPPELVAKLANRLDEAEAIMVDSVVSSLADESHAETAKGSVSEVEQVRASQRGKK